MSCKDSLDYCLELHGSELVDCDITLRTPSRREVTLCVYWQPRSEDKHWAVMWEESARAYTHEQQLFPYTHAGLLEAAVKMREEDALRTHDQMVDSIRGAGAFYPELAEYASDQEMKPCIDTIFYAEMFWRRNSHQNSSTPPPTK